MLSYLRCDSRQQDRPQENRRPPGTCPGAISRTRRGRIPAPIKAAPEPAQAQIRVPASSQDRLFRYLGFLPFLILLSLPIGHRFRPPLGRRHQQDRLYRGSLANNVTLPPNSYVYPGVNYWLTFSGLLPELAGLVLDGETLRDTLPACAPVQAFSCAPIWWLCLVVFQRFKCALSGSPSHGSGPGWLRYSFPV